MVLKFKKIEDVSRQESHGYDLWEVSNNSTPEGTVTSTYYVPVGTDGEVYHQALRTAQQKLVNLGFTETEAKAILGRQLF